MKYVLVKLYKYFQDKGWLKELFKKMDGSFRNGEKEFV